jgi:hypothetical protein
MTDLELRILAKVKRCSTSGLFYVWWGGVYFTDTESTTLARRVVVASKLAGSAQKTSARSMA